ncbi:MAG: YeeE/YedE family protein [Rhizobiales bacterium]|nr:YeeE/YedE family protein [Hyphomicrobiales bacterium]
MTNFAPLTGLGGGALIGLAAVMLMLGIGRIAGVCGIALNAMTASDASGRSWRLAFMLGLPLGALLVTAAGLKDWSGISFPASVPTTIVAGFIVGVGSTFGSGCTSGHGICGLARFSQRSLVATATFIAAAAATVFVIRHVL